MSRDLPPGWRVPLLIAGFASLAVGVGAGLMLLGWQVPTSPSTLPHHGPLMISGFFGTVISLERAVALRRLWAYLGPLCSGAGGLALILSFTPPLAPALIAAGSLVLVAASVVVFVRHRAVFTLILALGSLCWLIGNVLWLRGVSIPAVVPWWIAFLVLTIAGERLELSRLLPLSSGAKRLFAAIVIVLLAGLLILLMQVTIGAKAFAAALLLLPLWLWRHDIARHTVQQQGLTRFIAVCLLSGYFWLAVGALILLLPGELASNRLHYDAALHAILLGFVFSMVFGHAPIIFPAVLNVQVPYHPTFYLPLIVLHASLLVRLSGDLLNLPPLRATGGMLNALALLLFIIGAISAVVRGKLATKTPSVA